MATHYEAAIALYDSCGWSNAGEVTMVFGDGIELQSYVYVAPADLIGELGRGSHPRDRGSSLGDEPADRSARS